MGTSAQPGSTGPQPGSLTYSAARAGRPMDVYRAQVGDRYVDQRGKEFEVTAISPPGTAGRGRMSGPVVHATIVADGAVAPGGYTVDIATGSSGFFPEKYTHTGARRISTAAQVDTYGNPLPSSSPGSYPGGELKSAASPGNHHDRTREELVLATVTRLGLDPAEAWRLTFDELRRTIGTGELDPAAAHRLHGTPMDPEKQATYEANVAAAGVFGDPQTGQSTGELVTGGPDAPGLANGAVYLAVTDRLLPEETRDAIRAAETAYETRGTGDPRDFTALATLLNSAAGVYTDLANQPGETGIAQPPGPRVVTPEAAATAERYRRAALYFQVRAAQPATGPDHWVDDLGSRSARDAVQAQAARGIMPGADVDWAGDPVTVRMRVGEVTEADTVLYDPSLGEWHGNDGDNRMIFSNANWEAHGITAVPHAEQGPDRIDIEHHPETTPTASTVRVGAPGSDTVEQVPLEELRRRLSQDPSLPPEQRAVYEAEVKERDPDAQYWAVTTETLQRRVDEGRGRRMAPQVQRNYDAYKTELERRQNLDTVTAEPSTGSEARSVEAPRPTAAAEEPEPGEGVTVEHTAEGTLVYGTSRGDTTVTGALKTQGFRWSRNLEAWYLPRNLTDATRDRKVDALKASLPGLTVESPDDGRRLTAAEKHASKLERAAERAERKSAQAEKLQATADAHSAASDAIREHIPLGQPILTDHYSAPRHMRAIARAHSHDEKSWDAQKAANAAQDAADRAAATATGQEAKSTIDNRIKKNTALVRKIDRELDGHRVAQGIIDKLGADHPTVTEAGGPTRLGVRSPERIVDLEEQKAIALDAITFDKDKLAAAGGVTYGRDNVSVGDFVKTRFGWSPVVRANQKTATVPSGYSWTDTVPWVEVTDVEKAENLSLDTINKMIAKAEDKPTLKALERTLARAQAAAATADKDSPPAPSAPSGAAAPTPAAEDTPTADHARPAPATSSATSATSGGTPDTSGRSAQDIPRTKTGAPDYGAMSAEQAAQVRAELAGTGVGARVTSDLGTGTVETVSTRGTTVRYDNAKVGLFHHMAGTPGHDRVKPLADEAKLPTVQGEAQSVPAETGTPAPMSPVNAPGAHQATSVRRAGSATWSTEEQSLLTIPDVDDQARQRLAAQTRTGAPTAGPRPAGPTAGVPR